MPLIQRIEVSNLMNSKREEPWRPDWPHQVFELNGENTAMNIPNGKGKSTLVLSILAMLRGHKVLNDCQFSPQWSQNVFGILEPLDLRRNGASCFSP